MVIKRSVILPVRVHASSIPTCALSLNARKALIFDAQFLKFRYKMYASILVVRSCLMHWDKFKSQPNPNVKRRDTIPI
jgi:hypothetical protein